MELSEEKQHQIILNGSTDMNDIKNAVYMTIMEQEQYVKLMKYYNVVQELDKIDFYSMKEGSVTIYKDRLGNISAIHKTEVKNFNR
jgi:hypothetical protein